MNCPMCGELWNDELCETCGWFEGKPPRYTEPRQRRHPVCAECGQTEPAHTRDDIGTCEQFKARGAR